MNRIRPLKRLSRTRAGFTVIELLAVLAIAGILIAAGTPSYLRWVALNDTLSAATTLSQEVARVRTQVKRSDTAITLQVSNGGHTITSDRTLDLPLTTVSGTLNLTFVPPYGTLATGTTTPQSVTITSTRNASVTRQVSVVSLFGKVTVK